MFFANLIWLSPVLSLYSPVHLSSLEDIVMEADQRLREQTTILLVEDEPDQSMLISAFLSNHGYRVLVAEDGAEAIELFKQHVDEIAVVLTDLGLPVLGGSEAFLAMKKIKPTVQAIVVTGYFVENVSPQIREMGANDVLHKPYDPLELLQKVQNATNGKKT